MATGIGLSLDTSFLKKLTEADKLLDKMYNASNKLKSSTISAFRTMTTQGVIPFVEELQKQKRMLEEIGKIKSVGKSTAFRNMQKDAKATVDELNKVIDALQKTKAFSDESSGKGAMKFAKSVLGKGGEVKSIDNMRRAISELEAAQNRQNLGTARGRKNYEKIGETIQKVKAELDKATGAGARLTNETEKTKSALEGLGGMISAAFAFNAIKRFINNMITIRGEFEMQHKSLQILLQDTDKANELWEKTVDLAVKSPFRVKDLVTYTKQLAAYRVEADKLYETNKMLADVSAGLGVDMNRLILAFGQVKAANFLRGTELRQFSEAGVNMLEELAKRFTMLEGRAVSVGEVFDRISKRMVSFKDVEAVFKTITSEGGVFYQMQEKQSETVKGMIMNLKDSIDLMFNDIGQSNESVLKRTIQLVRELVDNWEKFKPVISGITLALVTTLVGFGISKVINAVKMATTAFNALWEVISTGGKIASVGAGPWIALATIIVGVITAIVQAVNAAGRLQKELNKIYSEDTGNLDKSIARYQDLVNRLRMANKGSQERRDIIEKLNSEYGKYLDFIVTEETGIDRLVDSYDILVKRMKEKAAAATYEKAFAVISDEYAKKMQKAQKDFEKVLRGENFFMNEIPLEQYGLMQRGKNLFGGETAASIIPTQNEINDLYAILEQRLEGLNEEQRKQLKNTEKQRELINSIVSAYYGKEFYIRFAEGDKDIDIIETILKKKEKELEIEEQISRAYKESLETRAARLEYDKLELEYSERQGEINAMRASPFEKDKMLKKLQEEFELNKIEIKFKFGQIGQEERDRLRNNILNWATATTKDVNNEIRRNLSNFMSEEEWSNFLITPDRQQQGWTAIIKEITDGYEMQNKNIQEQLSLKSAGRKIDEKGLEFAQKQAKAYEAVADILGIELKKQDRISEELRTQVNELMPAKHKISLEDAYKGIKTIQTETSNEYKAQVATIEMLIAQKRAGIVIDGNALETAREDLEILREKMKLLGMKVDKPMSETTRNSINYFLPEEFKISDTDALKGVTAVNNEAVSAFQNAQKELETLLKMQDQQVEGLEDEILLLESQLPYLQRKVELTGTEIKDRLSELQLIEINAQLSGEHQLDEINLYRERSAIISEIQTKEKNVADMIRAAKDMREEGLTIEDGYIEKLEDEYIALKSILDLIDPSTEEPIDRQRMYDINSKLDQDYWIDVIDSQKSEVTLLQEANSEKEKAIAYEAQLLAMQQQGITVTQEQLDLAKKDVEQWTLRWKLLGGTEEPKKDRSESLMDERIKVVDDMNKAYKDLNQTLSKTESLEGAFAKYKDAFQKAYAGTTLLPKNFGTMTATQFLEEFNFTTEEGMIGFFDKLIKYAKKTSERVDVELAKGDYIMETRVTLQKETDQKLYDEIQEMFDKYDLSLELKELNLPPDVAKALFDIDTVSLDELKDKITDSFMGVEMYSERIKDAGKLMEDTFNGNVDLLNRKLIPAQELANKGWKDVGDGIATVFSSSYSVTDATGKNVDILVTPILPDGTVMSEKELEDYIAKKIEGASDVLAADDKGIIIHAGVDMEESLGEYLHSLQEVFYASDMLSEDQKAKYKEFIEKINDMEAKAQIERLQTYLKYTRDAIGERAKIKVEEMTKLMEIEETFNKAIADAKNEEDKKRIKEQKELAIEGVQKEASQKEQKMDWDEFRSTDTFVAMFQDLETASKKSLEYAIEQIKKFRKEWTDMPVSEAKEMIDILSKLETKLAETGNPFEDFKTGKSKLEQAMADRGIKADYGNAESRQALRDSIAEENEGLEASIAASNQIITTLETINNARAEGKEDSLALLGITDEYVESLGLSTDVLKNSEQQNRRLINSEKNKRGLAMQALASNRELTQEEKNQVKRLQEQSAAIGEAQKMANDLYGAFTDLADALGGGDSPAMIFADMGMNMLNTVLNTLQLQLNLQAATIQANALGIAMNSAMGVIGWIVMAIQLLAQGIAAAVNYADKMRQMKLDVLANQVENLKQKYDKLAESIDEAWSYKQLEEYSRELDKVQAKMIQAQKQYVQLLRSGKDEEKTISTAEKAQAKLDAGASVDSLSKKEKEALLSEEYKAYKDAKDALAEMEEDYVDQKKELLEELGGITDPRDTAEEFVDAWLDAYKETGDGLSGLDEKFDEFFENLIKKKATMIIAEKALTGWVNAVNNALDQDSAGGYDITDEEQKAINNAAEAAKEQANKILLGIFEGMDFNAEGEGLSGLQKGIQGITEDQADILAAYWNSVRGYTASIDSKMDLILANMGVTPTANPQLEELINQTTILGEIDKKIATMNETINGMIDSNGDVKVKAKTSLDTLVGTRANGGAGLKIVMD